MTARIYSAADARALREAATPGPWDAGAERVYSTAGCDRHRGGLDRSTIACLCRSVVVVDRDDDRALIAAAPDLTHTVEHLEARALAAEERHAEAVSLALRLTATGEELLRDLDGARAELAALRGALARRVTDATRAGEPKHVLTPAGPGDRLKRRARR